MTNVYTLSRLWDADQDRDRWRVAVPGHDGGRLANQRATVEEGLRRLVRVHEQAQAVAYLKGLGWEGDLDDMRQGRMSRSPLRRTAGKL